MDFDTATNKRESGWLPIAKTMTCIVAFFLLLSPAHATEVANPEKEAIKVVLRGMNTDQIDIMEYLQLAHLRRKYSPKITFNQWFFKLAPLASEEKLDYTIAKLIQFYKPFGKEVTRLSATWLESDNPYLRYQTASYRSLSIPDITSKQRKQLRRVRKEAEKIILEKKKRKGMWREKWRGNMNSEDFEAIIEELVSFRRERRKNKDIEGTHYLSWIYAPGIGSGSKLYSVYLRRVLQEAITNGDERAILDRMASIVNSASDRDHPDVFKAAIAYSLQSKNP